jgi:hypothetical protein
MSGPGPLDLVALSLATSRLVWTPDHLGEVTPEGYAITTTGDNPAYHVAFKPGGRSPTNELCAGAGDLGLAKCKRYCERHFERSQAGEQDPGSATAHPANQISNIVADACSNDIAAPTSTNVPTSPAQTALF